MPSLPQGFCTCNCFYLENVYPWPCCFLPSDLTLVVPKPSKQLRCDFLEKTSVLGTPRILCPPTVLIRCYGNCLLPGLHPLRRPTRVGIPSTLIIFVFPVPNPLISKYLLVNKLETARKVENKVGKWSRKRLRLRGVLL